LPDFAVRFHGAKDDNLAYCVFNEYDLCMRFEKRACKCVRLSLLIFVFVGAGAARGQGIRLVERAPDPHGSPRPARDDRDVPLRTSLYFQLAPAKTASGLKNPSADSVAILLKATGRADLGLLRQGGRFARGGSGWLKPTTDLSGATSLAVYLELPGPLEPATTYTVFVSAAPEGDSAPAGNAGSWTFTTTSPGAASALDFTLNLAAPPLEWHGHFFSGLCNVTFCSEAANYGPTYDLMTEARKLHPLAWSYQRDFWPTGSEFRPGGFLPQRLPNIIREGETRRISAIEPRNGGVLLRLADLFGREQYGIPAGRSLAEEYHPGDRVLIADGVSDAQATVISVDVAAVTLTVTAFASPPSGWKIAYDGPLPEQEDPDAPGLFPPGGCYLRKFLPCGTPYYYWGRLDKEWDLIHRKYGRRIMVNFADAPGDLARDGRSWTTVKDYAEWHETAKTIAGHIIDRYGVAALSFTWSVFNEPDLLGVFWRADWNELQRFYDYTSDAILRAFEDRGYDSNKVFIGGLELGGIFGTNLKLHEFLAHCSPTARAEGALPLNAAVADHRLDGKRSKRVDFICRGHGGKGAPCDFISIHSYNRAEMMAAKLIRAKEIALQIDPDYYKALWINSHESCPDWLPPPDQAAADSYLGNGYFPSWCLDVVRRLLRQAERDSRYAYGEAILTVWPPPANFAGLNAITRVIHCDDNGDGRLDRTVTIPMPIFHALGMLSDLGPRYWVLPERTLAGNVVSGFASRDGQGTIRILLYAHDARDTQSRSDASFDMTLDVDGVGWAGPAWIEECRIDREHNSPFKLIREILDRPAQSGGREAARLAEVIARLQSDSPALQRQALETLTQLDARTQRAASEAVLRLAGRAKDKQIRDAAAGFLRKQAGPVAYPAADIEKLRKACECHPSARAMHPRQANGHLRFTVRVASNGCNFVTIKPDRAP
jgi:hypothetical protein